MSTYHLVDSFGSIVEAYGRMRKVLAQELEETQGLNLSWFEVLLRISRSGGQMKMADIANQVVITTGGITKLMDKMVEQGLIKRTPCNEDRRIVWAFHSVSLYDVHSLNLVTLQNIAGIGLKTARFYWMNCVPNQNYAILDTHILKWLRMQGYDVPKSTPSKNKYLKIEQIFLEEAKKRNKTPIELDLEIWLSYAKKQEIEQSVKSAITEEVLADLSFLPIPTQNCV